MGNKFYEDDNTLKRLDVRQSGNFLGVRKSCHKVKVNLISFHERSDPIIQWSVVKVLNVAN